MSSIDFIDDLLNNHQIFIAPGSIFGSNGEGYVRFSLCNSKENIIKAISRL
jgi:aspartate/methionine/tyrosine aminotransferase